MLRMIRTILILVSLAACTGPLEAATELGTEGGSFTVNGRRVFLLGISYYGALGAPRDFIKKDLVDMQRLGINWIRVWATWRFFGNDVSAVDGRGRARQAYLDKLLWLTGECDRRGIIVDVTLSRGDGRGHSVDLPDFKAHFQAVGILTRALKRYKNWYIDLANERNIRDSRYVSLEEVKKLRDEVKRIDPSRLVTASHAGDIDRGTFRAYVQKALLDFVAPHRPRNARSPGRTEARTRRYLAWAGELKKHVPIHYQEPFRRGFAPHRWEPTEEAFVIDLTGALRGGAAGWCFHNGDQKNRPGAEPHRSFDMSKRRLFDQLDAAEKQALKRIAALLRRESRQSRQEKP